jgi:hypothetical protein
MKKWEEQMVDPAPTGCVCCGTFDTPRKDGYCPDCYPGSPSTRTLVVFKHRRADNGEKVWPLLPGDQVGVVTFTRAQLDEPGGLEAMRVIARDFGAGEFSLTPNVIEPLGTEQWIAITVTEHDEASSQNTEDGGTDG